MHVRTSKDGVLTAAATKVSLDLTLKSDRKVARRFAERIIALCDWWENQL